MKIARIESFIFGTKASKDLIFCRVETEDGHYGWGEAYCTAGKEKVLSACIEAMAPHIIGRTVFNIRHNDLQTAGDLGMLRDILIIQ